MKKKPRSRVWLWLLLLVILAAVGYYLYTRTVEKPEKTAVALQKPPSPETTAPKPSPTQEEKIQAPIPTPESAGPTQEEVTEDRTAGGVDCEEMEEDVADFFRYLDKQPKLRKLDRDLNAEQRFLDILQKLRSRPPVPAGEGIDHRIMIGNLYHLFRTLSRQDIQLIRAVIEQEQDALELHLMLFYQWLSVGDRCPDPQNVRPPFEAVYAYAGFFLNTTGGRAYLYRRSTGLRLLMSYYCLLILHEADQMGKNTYGIDTAGFIRPLRDEFIHYPDLQFQRDYVERLSRMEAYYLQKR